MYNTETIEKFIDLTPKNDFRTQTKAAWGSNIFWLLISLIGFGVGGAAFAYGIIIICLGVFASVVFQIKRKDKTVYGVVFLSSFLSLLFVINFTLAAEIFCELAALPIALKSAAAAVPVIAAFAFTFVIDRRVKNGAIKDSKGTGKSNKAVSSAVWGALGISFARLFIAKLKMANVVWIVAVILLIVLASLCSLGTAGFLKVYYINKYNLEKYKGYVGRHSVG